jgi:hypothetical protein
MTANYPSYNYGAFGMQQAQYPVCQPNMVLIAGGGGGAGWTAMPTSPEPEPETPVPNKKLLLCLK